MSETLQKVTNIVSENLGVEADKVQESSNFVEDLGADLDQVELVAFEEEFGIEIPDDAIEKNQDCS